METKIADCTVVGFRESRDLHWEYDETRTYVKRITPVPGSDKAFLSLMLGDRVVEVQLKTEDIDPVLDWLNQQRMAKMPQTPSLGSEEADLLAALKA